MVGTIFIAETTNLDAISDSETSKTSPVAGHM